MVNVCLIHEWFYCFAVIKLAVIEKVSVCLIAYNKICDFAVTLPICNIQGESCRLIGGDTGLLTSLKLLSTISCSSFLHGSDNAVKHFLRIIPMCDFFLHLNNEKLCRPPFGRIFLNIFKKTRRKLWNFTTILIFQHDSELLSLLCDF